MIQLVSKIKRKGKVFLTFKLNVTPEISKHGGLIFRPWMAIDIDGGKKQDPDLFKHEIAGAGEHEFKITLDAEVASKLKTLEVGIVKELVAWFHTIKIDL